MIDRAQALEAVQTSANLLNLHPNVSEETKISDFCGDSLEYLELLLGVEFHLALEKEVPDGNAPAMDVTVGKLADWVVEAING